MRFRISSALVLAAAGIALFIACGSRTGLDVNSRANADGGDRAPLYEGGALDAHPDCSTQTYCDPSDPSHIYQCGGVPVYLCGSLEQCEARDPGPAQCVNPCRDTLGNDTSNGCEFYAVEMDTTDEAAGSCYAVFVVNQWKTGEAARIQVTLPGENLPAIEQYARIPVGKGTGITYAPYNPEVGLPANEIAILFLSRDPNFTSDPKLYDPRVLASCPEGVIPAVRRDAALHGTGIGTAFRIETNVPVVAYQMLPYGAGRARVTGSTLLMPTNTWDVNYVIADAYRASSLLALDQRAGPTTVVIASQDATHVTIDPTVPIASNGNVQGTVARAPVTYTLNQGQYLQITPNDLTNTINNPELTGSALQSDKPVGVIGGSTLMDIPANGNTERADSAHQMIPPVHALGSEYVAVRYRNRMSDFPGIDPSLVPEETPPWRMVGVVDGTQVTFDPPRSAVGFNGELNAAPFDPSENGWVTSITLNAGDLVEFSDSGPFVVTSDGDHPFLFASYMTGGGHCHNLYDRSADGGVVVNPPCLNDNSTNTDYQGYGDPEFIVVVPPAQYLPRYTFFTDPTYPETNLVVIRMRDGTTGQMPDVTLDCAGVLGNWQSVGTAGTYEMTRVDLSTRDFEVVNGCENGVHTITASFASPFSDGGPLVPSFGVTIWGWGNSWTFPTDITSYPDSSANDEQNPNFTLWVSYGYPAGANFRPLNSAVISALR